MPPREPPTVPDLREDRRTGPGATESIVAGVRAEVAQLLADVADRGILSWDDAHTAWRRAVRRVVLGEQARDDDGVHTLMDRLRALGNWSFLAPRARGSREALRERLRHHIEHATPGSLAARLRDEHTSGDVEPVDQIPQWLFAADPALMAAHRALALLAADDERARAREQVDTARGEAAPLLPRLRAAVLESVRLWPMLAHHDVELLHREAPLDPTNLPASLSPFASAFTLTDRP